jgi:hypothetical protein
MVKRTVERREYIEAAAGFSWLESGHADMKQCPPTPAELEAPEAEFQRPPRNASGRPAGYAVPAPRRSTT